MGGVNVYVQLLLTWMLDDGEWSASPPSRSTPGETARGQLAGPRAHLEAVVKEQSLPPLPSTDLPVLVWTARTLVTITTELSTFYT